MSTKREPTVATIISISFDQDSEHVILRDLNGKQYIISIEDPTKLGNKLLGIIKDGDLRPFDIAHISISNEGAKTSPEDADTGEMKFGDFSKENIQGQVLKMGFDFLKNMNASPKPGRRY